MSQTCLSPSPASWRKVQEHEASLSLSHSLLLLENTLEVDCLDIDKGLYGGVFTDSALNLTCRGILDVIEQPGLFRNPFRQHLATPILQVKFFPLDIKVFRDNHDHDDYLCAALLTQYHLRILEKMLELCQTHQAVTLLLIFGEETAMFQEVYQPFTFSCVSKGRFGAKQSHCALEASPTTTSQVIKALSHHEQAMRQTLWKGQTVNYTFRRYLANNLHCL
jgi:hypothetical protein